MKAADMAKSVWVSLDFELNTNQPTTSKVAGLVSHEKFKTLGLIGLAAPIPSAASAEFEWA
jgi:hypothetical protein